MRRLDSRRVKDVRRRAPGDEVYADVLYKSTLERRRITEILGPDGAAEYERNLSAFRKHWNTAPDGSTPGKGW